MDMVTITCPKCGMTETFQHPDMVPVRKNCPGCVAERGSQERGRYQLPRDVVEMIKNEELEELRRAVRRSLERIP